MKHASALVILALVFSACVSSQGTPDIGEVVQPSPTVAGPVASNTPVPSWTPRPPTDTPEPTDALSPSSMWARNYLGATESAGVRLEVVRVLVGDTPTIEGLMRGSGGSWEEFIAFAWDEAAWANADGAVEIMVRLTNGSDSPVDLAFICGGSNVQIGSFQAELFDVGIEIGGTQSFCDDTLWPGASAISGVWVPLNNLTPDEVTSIILRVAPPTEAEGYAELGPWFIIEIDVSDHRWEEMPEELR